MFKYFYIYYQNIFTFYIWYNVYPHVSGRNGCFRPCLACLAWLACSQVRVNRWKNRALRRLVPFSGMDEEQEAIFTSGSFQIRSFFPTCQVRVVRFYVSWPHLRFDLFFYLFSGKKRQQDCYDTAMIPGVFEDGARWFTQEWSKSVCRQFINGKTNGLGYPVFEGNPYITIGVN